MLFVHLTQQRRDSGFDNLKIIIAAIFHQKVIFGNDEKNVTRKARLENQLRAFCAFFDSFPTSINILSAYKTYNLSSRCVDEDYDDTSKLIMEIARAFTFL